MSNPKIPAALLGSRTGEILEASFARMGEISQENVPDVLPLEQVAIAILAFKGAIFMEYPELLSPDSDLRSHMNQAFSLACPRLFLDPKGYAVYQRMEKAFMADLVDIRNDRLNPSR